MALTRAQLLVGDTGTGTPKLAGQVQGVRQGIGVIILNDGTINFDASTATGVMRLNDPNAYNAYTWPVLTGPPPANTILFSDGAGNVNWTGNYVPTTGPTGAGNLPVGTTGNRPTAPNLAVGQVRYNSQLGEFEGYGGSPATWGPLGGMPTGANGDKIFYLNSQVVTADYTLPVTPLAKNSVTAGPITINAGITVTVPAGQAWSIV